MMRQPTLIVGRQFSLSDALFVALSLLLRLVSASAPSSLYTLDRILVFVDTVSRSLKYAEICPAPSSYIPRHDCSIKREK